MLLLAGGSPVMDGAGVVRPGVSCDVVAVGKVVSEAMLRLPPDDAPGDVVVAVSPRVMIGPTL